MAVFGFIGMGNMGYAILKGLLKGYAPEALLFTDSNAERMRQVTGETGVPHVVGNAVCAGQAKYVILAIKPQQFQMVLGELAPVLRPEQIVVSIAPGITTQALKQQLGMERRIVRAMPNTPALIGEGMTGITYEESLFSDEEQGVICRFFESFGKVQFVEEKLMDAVVCASGSSPAYVFLLMEALADSVVKRGMPRAMAYQMVAQTVAGSAKLLLETGEHPGRLKDQVCSPGGTTIAGVAALEEFGFRGAVMKATDACYGVCERAKEN